jgi:2'-5' RNA ligase
MNRLFIALNLPPEIKEDIVELRDSVMQISDELKWEPVEKLHLTLKFLGNVKNSTLEQIKEKLMFIEDYNSFNCRFSRFGFFYQEDRPRILWLGLNIDNRIFSFIGRLNEELKVFPIKQERRKFKPHLTLMRVKKPLSEDFIISYENFKLPEKEFVAGSISLIKSELNPQGSRYTEIKRYNLKNI